MHDPKALALIGLNEASGAFLGPFSLGVSMVEEYAKAVEHRCRRSARNYFPPIGIMKPLKS